MSWLGTSNMSILVYGMVLSTGDGEEELPPMLAVSGGQDPVSVSLSNVGDPVPPLDEIRPAHIQWADQLAQADSIEQVQRPEGVGSGVERRLITQEGPT